MFIIYVVIFQRVWYKITGTKSINLLMNIASGLITFMNILNDVVKPSLSFLVFNVETEEWLHQHNFEEWRRFIQKRRSKEKQKEIM